MKENVIIVNCKVPSEAYQILSMLRQNHENESFTVSQAAVVKKDAGHLSLEDAFIGGATEARGWTGGLIGSLVGLLAGPLGVLLGGGIGSLIGDSMDLKELEEKSELLSKASECLVDGETALLLMAEEDDETALGAMLKEFAITITRMDATEIAAEIETAEKKEELKAATKKLAEESNKAPDYSRKECWYQLPEITKDVDTFYICATEYIMSSFEEGAPDYATLDNPEMLLGAKVEYRDHASAYADSTNVFVPYTRQSGLRYAGEIHKKDGNIDAALLGVPYEDITAALDYYFENCNGGRPFILAGHSQGSAMALLLLRTYFKGHPEYYSRMVAAYTIGYSVTNNYLAANPHLKFATGESDTGVIIAWNTEGPGNVEANAKSVVLLPGTRSINPLNWKLDETYAPASQNLGSIILDEKTGEWSIGDVGADAQINLARGTVVTNVKVDPMPEDVAKVAAEFFGPDGRHGFDYMYYYNNIKANVAKRVETYMANK